MRALRTQKSSQASSQALPATPATVLESGIDSQAARIRRALAHTTAAHAPALMLQLLYSGTAVEYCKAINIPLTLILL